MKNKFVLKKQFSIAAETIYKAWLNGEEHTKMTGGEATGEAKEGFEFTAWDGYISGSNLELIPNQKIVQAWRTSEFNENDKDSRLEINFASTDQGCELTLIHSDIPEDQVSDYEQGWEDHYFAPMKEYFG
jgi:activator of HSP90 ATPase